MTVLGPALTVCMLGRTSSGKTTYLSALWALLKDAEPGASFTLRGALPAATAYLDLGAHSLLAAEPVPRTARDTAEDVSLELLLDGEPLELDQLDVSGETVEAGLVDRGLPRALMERLGEAHGLLLFTHPGDVVRPFTIPEGERLVRAAGEVGVMGREPEPLAPMDDQQVRRAAPTAVQLVDLLQIASSAAARQLPVALIVSAWDLVPMGSQPIEPRAWLSRAMPLLGQFLDNHREDLPSRVFGVSAQGGDYADGDVALALSQQSISKRARVVTDEGVSNDLAEPLRWFLRSLA